MRKHENPLNKTRSVQQALELSKYNKVNQLEKKVRSVALEKRQGFIALILIITNQKKTNVTRNFKMGNSLIKKSLLFTHIFKKHVSENRTFGLSWFSGMQFLKM